MHGEQDDLSFMFATQLHSAKDTEREKHKAPSQNISFNAVYTPRTISAVLFCRHKKPRQGMYA